MICAWCGNEQHKCDGAGQCMECGRDRDTQWRDMLEYANAAYMRQVIEANTLRKALKEITIAHDYARSCNPIPSGWDNRVSALIDKAQEVIK